MPPVFFEENVIAVALKLTWMIYTDSAVMRLFSHKFAIIFNAFASAE
jgi:hypothetical protein